MRFDWINHTSLLQTQKRFQWRPKAFFERLYHMDEKSLEDWTTLVVGTEPEAPERVSGGVSDNAREYALAVLKPGQCYSLPKTVEVLDHEWRTALQEHTEYFQLLRMHAGRSRTRVIRTVDSRHDPLQTEALALFQQPISPMTGFQG